MRLNINATGMNAVPFRVGISEEAETERLVIVVFLSGVAYSPSQLDTILTSLSSKTGFEWLKPTGKLWDIDADKLTGIHEPLRAIPWFKGRLVSSFDTQFGTARGSMGNFDQSGRGLAMVGHHPFTALAFSLDKEVASDSNCLFYSWMSDRESYSNRGFIQDCLEKAVKQIGKDVSIGITPSLDRDTKGETGSPDIAATIFRKIARARAFVADITLMDPPIGGWRKLLTQAVGLGPFRLSPNPNVLVELGFAAGQMSWERCLLVFNSAFGSIEQLPFDLRGRRIVTYHVGKKDDRQAARESFIPLLKSHLVEALDLKSVSARQG